MELTFVNQILEAREKDLIAIGEARGETRGQIKYAREELRISLEDFYGDEANEVVRKIDLISDCKALSQLNRFILVKRPALEEIERKVAELLAEQER